MGFVDNVARFIIGFSQEVLNTNVWSMMALFVFVLFLNAALLSLILEHVLVPETHFGAVVTTFTGFSFLIGNRYSSWKERVKAQRYASLQRYVAIVERANETITYLQGLHQSAAESAAGRPEMERFGSLRDSVVFVAWYSYRVFFSEDREEIVASESPTGHPLAGVSERALREAQMWKGDPVDLARRFTTKIIADMASLQREGLANDVFIQFAVGNFEKIMQSVSDIAIESTVREPRIYSALSGFMTVFWVFVWMPVNIWIPLGTAGTLILYPVLAVALTGDAVFDAAKGNTFDPKSSIKTGEPHKNRLRMLANANEMHV